MRKLEASLTTRLKKHILHSGIHMGNCAIEVKITTGKSIAFSDFSEHQIRALGEVSATFVHKISDDSQGKKPFDLFVLQNAGAYVALAFLAPRKQTVVYLISLPHWLALQQSCGRKSVTEEMMDSPSLPVMKLVLPSKSQALSLS